MTPTLDHDGRSAAGLGHPETFRVAALAPLGHACVSCRTAALALATDCRDDGSTPRPRRYARYGPFVPDPDGHDIEAARHLPENMA